MARGTTESERREAVTLVPAGEVPPLTDEDIESAFENWRASFEHATEPGKIRAFQIPIDERGMVSMTAKTQTRLGAWAIDLYDFDELCAMLMRDFMRPGDIMAVRFIGTEAGERGVRFNRTVILRRSVSDSAPALPAGRESLTEVLTAIQAMNERMMAMMERTRAPAADTTQEIAKLLTLSHTINAPMNGLIQQLIPALIGRPPAAPGGGSDVFGALNGALDVVEKLKDMTGGGGDGGGGGPDWLEALRTIVPIAKPALEAIPHIAARLPAPVSQARPPQPRPVPAQPMPGAVPGTAPTSPGVSPPSGAPVQPAFTPSSLGDIPSGDHEMFAQLKPQIDTLVGMAAQGSDPAAAADLLFDQVIMTLPDEYYDQVCDIIEGPNFVKNAAVFNPDVAKHVAFFEAFRKQLMARIEREASEADQVPSAPAA